MLTFTLPERDPLYRYTLYIRQESVRACATGVVFVASKRIAVVDLAGCSLYLYDIDMDAGRVELLDSRMTTDECDKRVCFSDLIDYDGDRLLVCSNMWLGSQTLYRMDGERLRALKTIPRLSAGRSFCHGVQFHPFRQHIIGTANFHASRVEFIDWKQERVLLSIPFPEQQSPKDLVWIDPEHVLVVHSSSDVLPGQNLTIPRSALALYRLDIDTGTYALVAEQWIEDSHTDCVIFRGGLVFVSHQDGHKVLVYRLSPETTAAGTWRFEPLAPLEGYNRPHGLAFNELTGLLAVTNYGDNSVRIRRLPKTLLAMMHSSQPVAVNER